MTWHRNDTQSLRGEGGSYLSRKAPICHMKGFHETSFVDWPGRLCAVLFLGGCNFRCPYCHNPDLVLAPHELKDLSWEKVASRLEALRGWLDGVCVTGGEPTLHSNLPDLLREICSMGFQVKLDTNGSRPDVLSALVRDGLVQSVSMDVKAPLRAGPYRRCSGVDAPIREITQSLEILGSCGLEVEFRTTFVPGLLERAEIVEIVQALPPRGKYTLQGFRPGSTLDPRLDLVGPCPEETLEGLRGAVREVRSEPVPEGMGFPSRLIGPTKTASNASVG